MDVQENSTVGKAEEEARKRRQKILSGHLWDKDTHPGDNEPAESSIQLPGPKFRSYIPHDENLVTVRAPTGGPVKVEELIKDELEAGKPEPVIKNIDLENLAPKKIDWDLKRNISKDLEKLERQTNRAIAELVRERIKAEQSNLIQDS